jgi:hypothetical protein
LQRALELNRQGKRLIYEGTLLLATGSDVQQAERHGWELLEAAKNFEALKAFRTLSDTTLDPEYSIATHSARQGTAGAGRAGCTARVRHAAELTPRQAPAASAA